MTDKKMKLFEEFCLVSAEEWQEKVIADLKGADFEKAMIWRTLEGFMVYPFYRSEDLEKVNYLNQLPAQFPYVRGTKITANNWYIRQDIQVETAVTANIRSLDLLSKGVSSLGFVFSDDSDLSRNDLSVLLRDISLNDIEINMVCNCPFTNHAQHLSDYITERYGKESSVVASINIDPLGRLTKTGFLDDKIFPELKTLIERTAGHTNLRMIGVNGKNFRDAGSSIVQELAFSLAMGAEYLTRLTDLGITSGLITQKIKFNFGTGSNYFMEIAKLRAARLLWAKLVQAYGVEENEAAMRIHSENTIRNKTVYDPYVNMLRTQTEAMSAVLGGTDSLTILPFNAVYEKTTPFSERIARNQQILLKEEAHFDKTVDPAAGSYYIETLTDSIAENAWNLFLEVQEKGGYVDAFREGFIQAQVNATAAKMDAAMATRKENLLGTNQFPNLNEYILKEIDTEVFKKSVCKSEKAFAEPLASYREAQAFETLRYATDIYSKEHKRPLVFLLTIGNLAMRKARAQFACNFFAIAGFEVKEGKGYNDVEEGVVDAISEGADIIVICSSDEEYAEYAPAAFEKLIDGIFVVAGNPACRPDLEARGITNYIHIRSNLLDELTRYQKELGI